MALFLRQARQITHCTDNHPWVLLSPCIRADCHRSGNLSPPLVPYNALTRHSHHPQRRSVGLTPNHVVDDESLPEEATLSSIEGSLQEPP
eukprot:657961-Pyramimonas_sp.AAC.1